MAKHKLDKNCIILGRATDMVDITLAHESISRQHARIAFDSQGIPWLRDLQSTHGTLCNKRRLPPPAVGKVESNSHQAGSRGVMIFPGDVLQFGASTRIYCVEGPEQYERQKGGRITNPTMLPTSNPKSSALFLSKLSGQQGQENQVQLNKNENNHETEGVSWGMLDMDDEDEIRKSAAGPEPKTLPMDLDNIPEKHRKSLERLNAMKYKLHNLQTEDERIRRKGELTEGQERQLQRNAERESTLMDEIARVETELYYKLYPDEAPSARSSSSTSKRFASEGEDADEEDSDFYDRTKKSSQQSSDQIDDEVESEQSMIVKWQALVKRVKQRLHGLKSAQAHEVALRERLKKLQEKMDEEAFFVQNDLQIAKESVQMIMAEEQKDQAKMRELERLLKFVNPKLVMDYESGYVGQSLPKVGEKQKEQENPTSFDETAPSPFPPTPLSHSIILPKPSPSGKDQDDVLTSMPPPPPFPLSMHPDRHPRQNEIGHVGTASHKDIAPVERENNKQEEEKTESTNHVMPPPKRKRLVGPSMPPPPSVAKGGAARQQHGTLAVLSSMPRSEMKSKLGNEHPSNAASSQAKTAIISDQRQDEWRAPEGQDGSGITKLNAKFAGRY